MLGYCPGLTSGIFVGIGDVGLFSRNHRPVKPRNGRAYPFTGRYDRRAPLVVLFPKFATLGKGLAEVESPADD